MKNGLKKVIMAACVLSATVVMSLTSAMAASINDATYTDGKLTVQTDLSDMSGKQMTVLILTKEAYDSIGENGVADEDILYINQGEATELQAALAENVGYKAGTIDYPEVAGESNEYVILMGGEDIESEGILVQSLVLTKEGDGGDGETGKVKLGDVNLDSVIDGDDGVSLKLHLGDLKPLTKNAQKAAADCNQDTIIDGDDGVSMMLHLGDLKRLPDIEVSYTEE